jgi:hypothetical protein
VKAFQTPAPHITRADRPAADLAADIRAIVARQRDCQTLADAAAHTHSPSDRIAYAHDAWLLSHPDGACATDDDYPGFAEYIAAREAANRKTELALKETS